MRTYILFLLTLIISIEVKAQFTISPQVGITYGKFEVDYFRDLLFEPNQKKILPSIGLRLNYNHNRILISTDINFREKTEFSLANSGREFFPPVYNRVNITDISMSCSYNIIKDFSIGAGVKIWRYYNSEIAGGYGGYNTYNNSYAMIVASYLIKKFRVSMEMSKYLSAFGGPEDRQLYEIVKAPELMSLKLGYDISFMRKEM